MTNKELIQKFEVLVANEKKATRLVLEHIAMIESRRAYFDLGFDGMYRYMVDGLGYSEAAAHRRIMASRTLKLSPEIGNKIEQGTLNLTQLAQVAQLSRATRHTPPLELFAKLENQGKSNSERILAEAFQITPKTATIQKTHRDESVRLELSFTKEQFEALQKAKSHLSHTCPDGDWAQILTELANRLNKHYEVKSAKKTPPAGSKEKIATNPVATQVARTSDEKYSKSNIATGNLLTLETKLNSNRIRRKIRITEHRELLDNANHQCQHIHPMTGLRCKSTYQLQVDHVFPLNWGGRNEIANYQILCAQHNRAKGAWPG